MRRERRRRWAMLRALRELGGDATWSRLRQACADLAAGTDEALAEVLQLLEDEGEVVRRPGPVRARSRVRLVQHGA